MKRSRRKAPMGTTPLMECRRRSRNEVPSPARKGATPGLILGTTGLAVDATMTAPYVVQCANWLLSFCVGREVKERSAVCRCSKIMSPPNCNETLSPYQDGDDESERAPTCRSPERTGAPNAPAFGAMGWRSRGDSRRAACRSADTVRPRFTRPEVVLPMNRPRRLSLHDHAQNAVNARLVALAMTLEPSEHVRIETNRQLLFRRGPSRRCLFEQGPVERRNVRIVNVGVPHAVNPFQVALDRSSVHVRSPFSWR